jgi:ElaB/YqjD/DUF883 family membrane-anchored ribosome-binding protein
MEGAVMKRFSPVLLFAALAVMPLGCSRGSSPEKPSSHAKSRDPIEQEERLLEQRAQQAKHDIDQITSEAEDVLKKEQVRLSKGIKRRSQAVSEYATEIAEEAKDQAEDIPEAVDQALERQAGRFRSSQRRNQVEEVEEEVASDADAESSP